jgi:hypothetical protein
MSKFKVGDRVRVVDESGATAWARVGDEYDVRDIRPGLGGELLVVDIDGRGMYSHRFELATPSPVRAVTRREIVPGVYGLVTVWDSGYVTTDNLRQPSDLREVARIFNEIADALDENAKEVV